MKNPFRYRSYYYDFETNLYYLNSRYYDPETGRFINADDIGVLNSTKEVLNGLNLYSYCLNNPINSIDDNGDIPNWLKWLIGGLIIATAAILTVVTAGGFAAAGAAIIGVFTGATAAGAAGFFAGVTVGAAVGGLIGAFSSGFTSLINGGSFWDGAADGFMWGAISGAISGGFSTFKFSGIGDIVNKFTNNAVGNKIHIIGQSIISMSTYFARSAANGEQVTPLGVALSIFNGVVGGLMYHASYKTLFQLTLLYEIVNITTTGLKKFLENRGIKPILI